MAINANKLGKARLKLMGKFYNTISNFNENMFYGYIKTFREFNVGY